MSGNAASSFIDTNVLVYLLSGDREKAEVAESVLRTGGVVSVQVVNELANVLRRKVKLSWPETREFMDTVRALVEVRPLTLDTHLSGLDIAERYTLSIYDSLIVAAALDAGCEVLLSEDMQNGMKIGERLRIVNPFQPA